MEVMLLLPGNSNRDCSFKWTGEMVVIKLLWSLMRIMLLLPGNSTVDCFLKREGETVVFKLPVEHNGGKVVPTLETILYTVSLS